MRRHRTLAQQRAHDAFAGSGATGGREGGRGRIPAATGRVVHAHSPSPPTVKSTSATPADLPEPAAPPTGVAGGVGVRPAVSRAGGAGGAIKYGCTAWSQRDGSRSAIATPKIGAYLCWE